MSNCCQTKSTTTAQAKLTIALCGNPNSGKTTLFNNLTGSNQKVGNWPGVTVEQKLGSYKKDNTVAIVDTPGIYSLSPFTIDEQIAHKYLMEGKPDLVINIVDSTNLERNLFLTSQLMELDVPVVVALNMQDEAKAKGIHINKDMLEEYFGCAFFAISAAKNQGIDELMAYCIAGNYQSKNHFVYSDAVEDAIKSLQPLTSTADNGRWTSLKLAEKDKTIIKMLNLDESQKQLVSTTHQTLKDTLGDIVSAQVAEQRYQKISAIVQKAQTIDTTGVKAEKAQRITEKIDKIVLNKWLAFPIFALIMSLVFVVSIGTLGGSLTDTINDSLTPWMQEVVNGWFANANVEWLRSLIVDGIIAGVMGVVGFVPQIMLLFGFIAILEASGYMSRIAFITDKLLNKIGLGGRSFVSMILGCGCSVPAIMATRTIKNINERNATITLTPFMPCSAKLAIISSFTTYILDGNALFAISFYFLSILAVILGGLIMKVFNRKKTNASDTFIMELPTYRAPAPTNVLKQMWERGRAFLIKAGTIIFTASVVLWLVQSFNFRFEFVTDANDSILAGIGKLIAPLFAPLGFNDGGYGWQYSVATLTGLAAKEVVVSTLEILLPAGLEGTISGLGAYSFVVYNLLTVPCVAAISASFTEQGNWKNGLKSVVFQLLAAYVVSLAIYQLGSLARDYTTEFVVSVSIIAIVFALYFAIRHIIKNRGCNCECDHCPHNATCTRDDRK
ncbi:MAG: ferrous iron transport protein B [Clostridia bacterium]|nr:ferrous iron transport protein B [Clostridia bacterium]